MHSILGVKFLSFSVYILLDRKSQKYARENIEFNGNVSDCKFADQLLFKIRLSNVANGESTALNAATKISHKTWKSSADYSNWEYKFHMNDSDRNMFNPILWELVQGRNIPGGEHMQIQEYLLA